MQQVPRLFVPEDGDTALLLGGERKIHAASTAVFAWRSPSSPPEPPTQQEPPAPPAPPVPAGLPPEQVPAPIAAVRDDLSSYAEVREHAEAIHTSLADGTMPCDAPWPEADILRFRGWIDEGMPA